MRQQIINDSTNYMKMFELLAQANAELEYAKEQPTNSDIAQRRRANFRIYILDMPVLEAHIFSLLCID